MPQMAKSSNYNVHIAATTTHVSFFILLYLILAILSSSTNGRKHCHFRDGTETKPIFLAWENWRVFGNHHPDHLSNCSARIWKFFALI